MEKTRRTNQAQPGSQFSHRPGLRIVTAVQSPQPHKQARIDRSGVTLAASASQANVLVEQQEQQLDQIDFGRLMEDAADLFGEDDDLSIDPSLSDLQVNATTTSC